MNSQATKQVTRDEVESGVPEIGTGVGGNSRQGAHRAPVVEPLSVQVYEWVKERIYRGELRSGERLNADELAREIGVSRTPLRDATNQLARDGLVVVHPRRGTVVATLTLDGIREVYEARLLIEPAVCEKAAKDASPELVADLVRIHAQADQIDPTAVYTNYAVHSRYAELDAAFHLRIVTSIGNPKLVAILNELNIQRRVAPLVFGTDYRGPANRIAEHRAILDAISNRSAVAARRAVRDHIKWARDDLVAFLTSDARWTAD